MSASTDPTTCALSWEPAGMSTPGSKGSVVSPTLGGFTTAAGAPPHEALGQMRTWPAPGDGSSSTLTRTLLTISALPEGGSATKVQPSDAVMFDWAACTNVLGAATSVVTVLVTLSEPAVSSRPLALTWATLDGVVGSAMLTTVAPAANAVPPSAMNRAMAPRTVPVLGREKRMVPPVGVAAG